MPIKFRCPHCRQFLGISRAKAGIVTDCPTCGRSIRVPSLEGKVAPLPAPHLDLQDDDLREALGALATLGTETPLAPKSAREPVKVENEPESAVVVAPLPYIEPEPVEPSSSIDILKELSSIPQMARVVKASPPAVGPARFAALMLLGLCLGSLIAGFWLGRSLTFRSAPSAAAPTMVAKPIPEVAEPVRGELAGTVRYRDRTGDWRPDKGARVIVLPMLRVGTARISGAGFRSGAVEADQSLLKASASALVGAFTLADENGRFRLKVPEAGRYSVLIASRHQGAEENAAIPSALQAFLDRYFDDGKNVLGNVKFEFREMDFDAGKTYPLDVDFEK